MTVTSRRRQVLWELRHDPERHMHFTQSELHGCCTIGGALDLQLIEAHSEMAPLAVNEDGTRCDLLVGECACGRIHYAEPPGT